MPGGDPGSFTGYRDIVSLAALRAADGKRFFGNWIGNAAIEQVCRPGLRRFFG